MNALSSKRFVILMTLALFLIGSWTTTSSAQLGRLKDAAEKLGKKTPGISSLLEGKPPITTSLDDAKFGDASKDRANPPGTTPLMSLQRTPNGGFVLKQGHYAMQTQSYCLKAGTHGPGGGDGYLYAPPKGPAEDAVVSIVRNSVN